MTDTVCAYLLGSEPSTRESLARQLGKKGTSSDVCLYNYDKNFTLEVETPYGTLTNLLHYSKLSS